MSDTPTMLPFPAVSHGEYLLLVEALATYTVVLREAASLGSHEERGIYADDAAETTQLLARLMPDPDMRTRLSEVMEATLARTSRRMRLDAEPRTLRGACPDRLYNLPL